MAQKIRFRLDGTIYNGIANAEDFGVTITEDTSLNFRFASFDNELQFVTDAYDYLNTLISDACGCGLVDVTVEYLCASQSWKRLCTGYLILSECVTDLDKCKITTKVFDNTFSTLINNNKSIPFSVRSGITKNLIPISTLPTWYVIKFFVPATGAFDDTNFVYCVRVEDALKHLVKCMTDDRVDCVAPPFASGQFQNLMITNGAAILSPQVFVETSISYQDLYLALTSKMRLGMKATLQDNGRPLLTIDYATNIDAQASNIDMALVSGVVKKVDTSMLYASVKFGNNKYYEQWECNGGDTACTFTQTPFRGYREETFGLLGDCNTSTQLDLSTKEVIFDTNIIEDIFVWGNRSYDTDAIIVNCEDSPIPIIKRAKRGDPYDIGQTVYNAEFTNEQVAARWIDGMPNSLVNYIEEFTESDTTFGYRSNEIPDQSWEVVFPQFTSFAEYTGDFIKFSQATVANTNYIQQRTFRVPASGIYTFQSTIVLEDLGATPDSRQGYASILRYSSNDEFIQRINGTTEVSLNINRMVLTVTAEMVCETGDLIRADASVALSSNGDPLTQIILDNGIIADVEYFTQFSGTGEPFQPGELQPYNPCEFKRNLYDFKKPLTMGQIQDLMDNPSAPVRFSRTENINAGATGVTSKVTIDSIVKQMATFTIRSNKNL